MRPTWRLLEVALGLLLGATLGVSQGEGAEWRVFFGNLHSHTGYSDGTGTPDEAYRMARDRAKLDFLAITEHNHREADGSGDRKDGILIAKDPGLYNGAQPIYRTDHLWSFILRMPKHSAFSSSTPQIIGEFPPQAAIVTRSLF